MKPTVFCLMSDIERYGKAYAFHKSCKHWNFVYAAYMVWLATRVNQHRQVRNSY